MGEQPAHELILFLLIWGEGANVRFLPEGLCFIFYCARLRLTFPRHQMGAEPPSRNSPETQYGVDDCQLAYGTLLPHEDFLRTVVTPLYMVLNEEIKNRALEPIDERIMYDDMNETFWHQEFVGKCCAPASRRARAHWASLLPIRRALRDELKLQAADLGSGRAAAKMNGGQGGKESLS